MNEPHRISGATELDLYRENQRLSDELSAVTGAMRADDARLRAAAMRIWGGGAFGCDTPDMMADEILTLRQKLASERALRERAERERDVERHVRVTVEAELKGERKAHEETKKANREAERIFLDELLARRAAESALADEREAHAETRASLEAAKRDHEGACLLVAKMHHAATGAIQGPIRGVVEDVADVRSRLAAALDDRAFLLELLGITVKTGTKDPLLDARLAEARAFLAGGNTK